MAGTKLEKAIAAARDSLQAIQASASGLLAASRFVEANEGPAALAPMSKPLEQAAVALTACLDGLTCGSDEPTIPPLRTAGIDDLFDTPLELLQLAERLSVGRKITLAEAVQEVFDGMDALEQLQRAQATVSAARSAFPPQQPRGRARKAGKAAQEYPR